MSYGAVIPPKPRIRSRDLPSEERYSRSMSKPQPVHSMARSSSIADKPAPSGIPSTSSSERQRVVSTSKPIKPILKKTESSTTTKSIPTVTAPSRPRSPEAPERPKTRRTVSTSRERPQVVPYTGSSARRLERNDSVFSDTEQTHMRAATPITRPRHVSTSQGSATAPPIATPAVAPKPLKSALKKTSRTVSAHSGAVTDTEHVAPRLGRPQYLSHHSVPGALQAHVRNHSPATSASTGSGHPTPSASPFYQFEMNAKTEAKVVNGTMGKYTVTSGNLKFGHDINVHWSLLPFDPNICPSVVSFDVSRPSSYITLRPLRDVVPRRIREEELDKPAMDVPLNEMNITCPHFPNLVINVKAKPRMGIIRCRDVYDAIYQKLHEPLSEFEQRELDKRPDFRPIAHRVFKNRCKKSSQLDAWEEQQGFRKVDLLGDHFMFKGLSRPSSKSDTDWIMHVGPHHRH